VHCTKISPEFKFGVKGQGHWDKKTTKCGIFSAVVLCGAVLCGAARGRGYAGGKISACCLVHIKVLNADKM